MKPFAILHVGLVFMFIQVLLLPSAVFGVASVPSAAVLSCLTQLVNTHLWQGFMQSRRSCVPKPPACPALSQCATLLWPVPVRRVYFYILGGWNCSFGTL